MLKFCVWGNFSVVVNLVITENKRNEIRGSSVLVRGVGIRVCGMKWLYWN